MIRRGRIQRDTSAGDGVVAVDGKQYAFPLEGVWQTELPPRAGMLVDVTFDSAGVPVQMTAVPDGQIAREQAEQALTGVKRQGGALAESVRKRYSVAVLIAEAGLLVSFFVLPSLAMSYGGRTFTAWDVIGMDMRTMMVNDHGLLSLLAIPCLLSPLAIPFLRSVWARWLYSAPLLYSLLAVVTLYLQVTNTGHAAQREMGEALGPMGGEFAREMSHQVASMFHLSFGIFAVFIFALYLAGQSRHPIQP